VKHLRAAAVNSAIILGALILSALMVLATGMGQHP
jgi:hypothetical protein